MQPENKHENLNHLNIDVGLTKTGLNPEQFTAYENEQKERINKLLKMCDVADIEPEPLTQDEIDLVTQQYFLT